MDEQHSREDGIQRAKKLVTTAFEAAHALERAQRAIEDLGDTQGALEEIAAIAYAIERSLTRARIAAEGIVDDLSDAAESAEKLGRRGC